MRIIGYAGLLAKPSTEDAVNLLLLHYFRKPLKYTGFGGKGKQVRDLLHPHDLFALLVKQLSQMGKFSGHVFNVGGGHRVSTSLVELTSLCEEVVGNKTVVGEEAETSMVDIPLYISDYSKASDSFDWIPERSLSLIVEDITRWIRENHEQLKHIFDQS